jgi:hypothetical protein
MLRITKVIKFLAIFFVFLATNSLGSVIQVQETSKSSIVAELIECKRKEGVLTVKIRFRNPSSSEQNFYLYTRGDSVYVTAENKKYLILKDSAGSLLATQPDATGHVAIRLKKDQVQLWWAKFPAPPAHVRKVNLMLPNILPFEDIPITDQ